MDSWEFLHIITVLGKWISLLLTLAIIALIIIFLVLVFKFLGSVPVELRRIASALESISNQVNEEFSDTNSEQQ